MCAWTNSFDFNLFLRVVTSTVSLLFEKSSVVAFVEYLLVRFFYLSLVCKHFNNIVSLAMYRRVAFIGYCSVSLATRMCILLCFHISLWRLDIIRIPPESSVQDQIIMISNNLPVFVNILTFNDLRFWNFEKLFTTHQLNQFNVT